MTISYQQPLDDAIKRTKDLLFRPFDIGRWFVMGFVVWLIHLGQSFGSAAGSDPEVQTKVRVGDLEGAIDKVGEGLTELLPAGLALLAVLSLVTLALVVAVALLWLSCRARFVWLENLTARDHAVSSHWSRHARLADSFFLWKLGYYLLTLVLVTPLVFFAGVFGALGIAGSTGPGSVLGWLLLGVAGFVVGAILVYVDFFAESFVTAIMHRRGLGVMDGWRAFRELFEAHPGHFVAVGLMKLLLTIVGMAALFAVGVATCCIGLAIMALPYLGSVFKLPVTAGLRYYDLCWLGQFADDLTLPALPPVSPDVPTPDSGPTP